jgi:hypothetical protein
MVNVRRRFTGWLCSDTGAVASANLYSLVATAKANRVEPHGCLAELFEQRRA